VVYLFGISLVCGKPDIKLSRLETPHPANPPSPKAKIRHYKCLAEPPKFKVQPSALGSLIKIVELTSWQVDS
jgi:hypothetical protein